MAQLSAGAVATVATSAIWDELVSATLLGSERGLRSGPQSVPSDPGELLDTAAAQAVARRAGARPRRFVSAAARARLSRPGPMPTDPRPLISPAAAQRLRSILDGYQKYLPEWLSVARSVGCRVPPVFFPELFELARNNPQIKAQLTVLLGEPGRWLAGLNPNWAFFLKDPADQAGPAVGQTGSQTGGQTGGATSAPSPGRAGRVPAPPVADFTAEARRLLARTKNSNDLYNLVMRQPGLWPEEGSRLLIEYVAAHRFTVVGPIDGAQPTARSSDWAIEQLQRTIGDHAPLHLRTMVAELIEEQSGPGAGQANPVVDLTEILDALTYRAAMHEELNARRSRPAEPEGRQP